MTSPQEPWTVLKLLDWTKGFFQRQSVESPRLCAEVLLAHAMGCKRVELYTRFEHCPSAEALGSYRDLVRRAGEGEPVAYLVGYREFYSLQFRVTPDVLIPRPETELLVDAAVEHLKELREGAVAWDVCTGSGCVALAVAANAPGARVLATDDSEAALAVAAGNAEEFDLADRVSFTRADLLALPSDCALQPPFDVLTANPPYVADAEEVGPGVDREPARALRAGADGLDVLRPLLGGAPDVLRSGGLLAVEFGCTQADAVRDLIVATGAFDEPTIRRDPAGHERAALARRR